MKKEEVQKVTLRDYLWILNDIKIPVLFLILIFVSHLISTFASMELSLFTGTMVDARGDVPIKELVSYCVSFLIIGLTAAASYIFSAFASEHVNLGIRTKLWQKIMYARQSCYDSDGGESLVSRVTADCDYASKLLTITVEILGILLSLILYVRRLYRLNVTLANAMMLLIPISMLFGWVYASLRFVIAQKTQAMLANTTTYLVERTHNINLIKTSNAQQEERDNGFQHFQEQYKTQIKTGLMTHFNTAMQWLFSILSLLIPFVVGASLVRDKVIRAGVVIAFYSLATTTGTTATNLINSIGSIRQANGALSRVISVLRMPDERGFTGATMDVPDQDIRISDISFAYGQKQVLNGVSCLIPKNKITAVIGHNGSGKSTLIKLLDRLNDPDGGVISFGGQNANEFDLHEWRKAFCLVAQDCPLIEGTIRENICYGCERPIDEEDLITVAKQARCYGFIQNLPQGFDTHIAQGGSNLSGGQRQCIAIARAIMNDPDYLLLDEATSNLDAQSERIVMEALQGLMKGRTTVIISHSLSTIRSADHVIVLNDGVVEQTGTPAEILAQSDNYLSKVIRRGKTCKSQ